MTSFLPRGLRTRSRRSWNSGDPHPLSKPIRMWSGFCSETKQVDITARGREVTLAKWILRRVKVERNRVVETALPGGGGGWNGSEGEAKKKRAPKSVARWERVSNHESFSPERRFEEVAGVIRTRPVGTLPQSPFELFSVIAHTPFRERDEEPTSLCFLSTK